MQRNLLNILRTNSLTLIQLKFIGASGILQKKLIKGLQRGYKEFFDIDPSTLSYHTHNFSFDLLLAKFNMHGKIKFHRFEAATEFTLAQY